MFAKLYPVSKPRPMWQVYWTDPLRLVKGKPTIHREHYKTKEEGERRQKELNKRVVWEGTAGLAFDAMLRADAIAARQHLDAKGHMELRLLSLAERYTAQVTSAGASTEPIGPEVQAFLQDKEHVEGRAKETLANLETRVWKWINLSKIATVGEINRRSVECLRTQKLDGQTRRNDMNAVSSFCAWLVDKGKIEYNPLAGVARPEPKRKPKPTFTNDECVRVLTSAKRYGCLPAVSTMLFAGARPSELEETRFIFGRHPLVRIEGGKLKGRANRTIPMLPALRAFLARVGNPERPGQLTRYDRNLVANHAAVNWKPDVCRHTFISNRLQIAQNDGMVAREAGTSEDVIYRHYHALKMPAEAKKWERIRPAPKPEGGQS